MAKNRVNQSAVIRFGPAVKALLLCLLIGGAGISYVWQKKQVFDLGRKVAGLEQQLSKLQKENELRRKQLDELHLPLNLERRARELNLGLVPASALQVRRLPEPLPERSNPVRRTSGVDASHPSDSAVP
jgi:cell division protein FtsL